MDDRGRVRRVEGLYRGAVWESWRRVARVGCVGLVPIRLLLLLLLLASVLIEATAPFDSRPGPGSPSIRTTGVIDGEGGNKADPSANPVDK
ncbi:hypothetical protein K457DRAFT_747460 [Linnemannia elongata AG-77]|uniref:Uncharacterized protein n=1 Tax=Linnemannia elongata AG-77 TaxID=1314771 RepID=A0A197JK96_9FUNG|nr:hypothetical protein K457DRAFT_747460 [Linnemannia elongata AG-77]